MHGEALAYPRNKQTFAVQTAEELSLFLYIQNTGAKNLEEELMCVRGALFW
jgi:hypothetical protein